MTMDLFGHPLTESKPIGRLGRRDQLTFRGNVTLGRHGWLRLTPAYSLHLVRDLLEHTGSEELVLEPFSGTGTTPLACASLGVRCHALDINPFLVWLGNLKLTRFDERIARQVKKVANGIAGKIFNPKRWDVEAWRPNLHQIEKWWDSPTLDALATMCQAIRDTAKNQDAEVTNLLRVAFCRVMIQSAHVSFGHQSMSFRKKGDNPSLIVDTPANVGGRLAEAFRSIAKEIADSLREEPPIADCVVYHGDSRDLPAVLPSERRYTTVITSPPYPNRMSYIRELRPYMYWLGYLSDGRAAGELDWQAIGGTWGCATSMLNTWSPDDRHEIPFPSFNRIVREISSGHQLLGRYVHKYFEDILNHVIGMKKVLTAGARCHYIVGNSKFYDTMLPVERIYAAIFEDAGYIDVKVETIRKRSSKKELYEFIVHAQSNN